MKAQTPAAKAHTPTAARARAPLVLKTQKDKFSYALGMKKRMTNLHKQSVPVRSRHSGPRPEGRLAGGKTLLTDEQAQAVLGEVQNDISKKQQAKTEAAADVNKKEGTLFWLPTKAKKA